MPAIYVHCYTGANQAWDEPSDTTTQEKPFLPVVLSYCQLDISQRHQGRGNPNWETASIRLTCCYGGNFLIANNWWRRALGRWSWCEKRGWEVGRHAVLVLYSGEKTPGPRQLLKIKHLSGAGLQFQKFSPWSSWRGPCGTKADLVLENQLRVLRLDPLEESCTEQGLGFWNLKALPQGDTSSKKRYTY